jgi:hypothetical protein
MIARQVLPRHFWLLGATLILSGFGSWGCGSSGGQGTGGSGGGAGAGATAGKSGASGGTGGASSGTGGASSATGGTNGGGGHASGGASGASGATGGAGGKTGTGGSGGGAGQSGSQTCTNPTYTLPLNPSNAQDGVTISSFYVDTDTWNAANYQVSQTMYICDYNNWYVVAKMDNSANDGAVKTYPDVHMDFSAAPAVSSFTAITSTFGHAGPHVGIYEFAYDMWLNGVADQNSTEVMIWTDNFNQVPSGTLQETVTFDGQSYQVYKSGSYIAFVSVNNVTSGTLNLLSFFNHVISKGWVGASSTLGAIDYGVELVSTNGMDETFTVDAFSLTTN